MKPRSLVVHDIDHWVELDDDVKDHGVDEGFAVVAVLLSKLDVVE